MKTLALVQGTDAWVAARASYFCASEAAAALGLDPKLPRNELIRMKATGDQREFSEWVRDHLLDKGHEIEAGVRADLEAGGTTFYPVTGTNGRFLASFDGINLDDDEADTGLEVKLWNAELGAAAERGEVLDSHWPQLEQQIMVGGLRHVLFVVSDGEQRTAKLYYTSHPERLARLRAGWLQFAEDVANYQHQEYIPAAKATPTEGLPVAFANAEFVKDGDTTALQVKSNLPAVRSAVQAFVDKIPAKPSTDQEFADCAAAVSRLEAVEKQLIAVKTGLIEQTTGVADAIRALDAIRDISSTARLATDKLVKRRKEDIKAEQVRRGQRLLAAHVKGLNDNLPMALMPAIESDFPGAIARLKTIDSLTNAIDTHLANKKIEANDIAEQIRANLKTKDELAKDYQALFPDLRAIVTKPVEDFKNLVAARVTEQKATDAANAEKQREKIAVEERAKLEREAQQALQRAPQPPSSSAIGPEPVKGLDFAHAARAVGAVISAGVPAQGVWREAARDLASVAPRKRPTDEELVAILANVLGVDQRIALQWLAEGEWQAMRAAA